jgi:F-type H+-transporting ATPase subunit b
VPLLEASPLGPLQVNATLLLEFVAFLVMLWILARWVYPRVMRAAESRQRQIAEQLEGAEKARKQAEERLRQSEQTVDEARAEAQRIIEAGRRSGEQAGLQAKERAEEEAKRILEQARRDSEAERQRALQEVRATIADLVVNATQRVLGESLDGDRHKKLIDRAVEAVAAEHPATAGNKAGGNGEARG